MNGAAPATAPAPACATRPWGRAIAWLLLLGPFFFASYGFATWWTSRLAHVGSLVFDWERTIPFIAWTIVPYWAIDALYAISLFLCSSRAELDRHALRLLTAQLISVSGFLLFPLQFTFARPEVDGVFGAMFAVLGAFDKPFNQAPSLHISLLLILWVLYAHKVASRWRWVVHGAFTLIGVSVLTTWQHHFIDVPTGLAAGSICLWLWPTDHPSPLAAMAFTRDAQRRRLAVRYALGATALFAVAAFGGGAWLWLCWASLALALVALIYAALDVHAFQKQEGRLSLAASALLAPYLAGAWINSRLWTLRDAAAAHVVDDVWIGRVPTRAEADRMPRAIVDCCAELPAPARRGRYVAVPVLDLVCAGPQTLRSAAISIERLRAHGPVLVCCALGYSRSATAIAAWLLHTGRARGLAEAIALLRKARPKIVLTPDHEAALRAVTLA
ncbi:MAG TPA: phosphatase PAP2/dual specificity phosphatase family protein [Casimicrobiaceae bacterium]|nr:phosphatase PAP2/dual specificity phosphatase family protein [Casimicrobiaceae bacterium]